MTAAAQPWSSWLLTGSTSSASSSAAQYIRKATNSGWKRLQDSRVVGNADLFEDLDSIAEECAEPDWDGYGAMAINQQTIQEARRVLSALPLGAPRPELGIEPDGQVTFEWHVSPKRTLSVSSSPDGLLHYAALIGSSRHYGTEPFLGDFPREIGALVQRIHAR